MNPFNFDNGISPEIMKIPVMNQFDIAYAIGGQYWMVLFWPTIFINLLIVAKFIEYGLMSNWNYDIITLGTTAIIFAPPMCIFPTIWYLHTASGVI